MTRFFYKAKNNKGEVVTGTVRAPDQSAAEKILITHNLVAIDIIPEKSKGVVGGLFVRKVSAKDKAVFSRQLATMLSAGLSLTRAINILIKQAKNERLKTIFTEIYRDLEEGFSFSSALAKHPEVFDRVYISVVSSGESTGRLDVVLTELADEVENDNAFMNKVKGSLYYPVFIFCVLIAAGFLLMIFVVPKLKSIFDQAGENLPLATRVLIGVSNFFTSWWWLAVILMIGLIVFIKYWIETESGKEFFNKLQIKTPGLKNIFEGVAMYRFTRVLSMLVGSGVPLLDALKTGSAVVDNVIYEEAIVEVAHQVEKGVSLSTQLLKDDLFPPLIGNMVAVGEETGELDKVLAKVSKYYEESTSDLTKTISSMVEPAVLVLIGLAVAFMVFAIYLPLYSLGNVVK
ncbi:MAG TPA: type II secretion system F family protein [Patescibacteria group bacterium]|nr:type II secretion system F family protein [Patescibacteria group bacterium]